MTGSAPEALRVLVARTTSALGDAVRDDGVLWDAVDGAESPADHYGAIWAAVALAVADPDDARWRALVDRWLARPATERGHLPFQRLAFLLLREHLGEREPHGVTERGATGRGATDEGRPALRAEDARRLAEGLVAAGTNSRHPSNNWVLLARTCDVLEADPRRVLAALAGFTAPCHAWLTEAGGFIDHPAAPSRGRLTTPLAYHAKFTLLLSLLAPRLPGNAILTDGLGMALRWMSAFLDEDTGSLAAFGRSTESLFGTGCALVALLAAWRGSNDDDRPIWERRLLALVEDAESRRRDDGLLALNARRTTGIEGGWDPYMHLSVYNAWAAGLLAWAIASDLTAPATATTHRAPASVAPTSVAPTGVAATGASLFHDPSAGLLACRGRAATVFLSLQGQPVQDVQEEFVDLRTSALVPFHIGAGATVAVPPPARLPLQALRRCPWMAGWTPVFADGDDLYGLTRLERVIVRGAGDGRLVVLGWGRPTRLHHVSPGRGSLGWWWEQVDHHLLGNRGRRRRGLSPPGLAGHHVVVALALDADRAWWGRSVVLLGRPADADGGRPIHLNPCGHSFIETREPVPVAVSTSGEADLRLTVGGALPAARAGARGAAGDPVAWPLADSAWTVAMGPGLGRDGGRDGGAVRGAARGEDALPMHVDLATATLHVPWGEVPMQPES